MTETLTRANASQIAAEEKDIRVEDYLNDKLQTASDLSSIDALLDDVKSHQILLQQQLEDARQSLDESTKAAREHSNDLFQRCKTFKSQQGGIDRRLLIVTRSETSDEAIHRFDSSMESLRKLDVAQGYMSLLTEVEDLSSQARHKFNSSPQAALEPYLHLQSLVTALKEAQPAAEDAAPHLVDHVDKSARTLWQQMKDAFGGDFENTLKKMQWPGKDVTLDGQLEQEWAEGVKKLLDLQRPELEARESQSAESGSREEPLVLLPLEVMAKPLELRFKYHFEGERPTNRLDKPEYFLSHVVGILNTYDEFFGIYLQPILRDHFRRSKLALTSIYINSTSALITSLLPMVRHKVFALVPQVSNQPQLLSHLIHELMSFDVSLREEWSYDGGNTVEGWKGVTWEVLVKKGWFARWLEVEKNFALSRYQNIIDAPETSEIDYDGVDQGATKPIVAAIRVNDLLETITDRYRPLTSFSQKLSFLIDIQITIFDRFHTRLNDSLEAYLTMTSTIARTVQGVSRESQAELQGLGGLEHLCRVYGSAEYLEKKMRDWSDDIFFLELWDELQDRARTREGRNLAGPLTIEVVSERTSSAVGSEEDTGALFDETAGAYRRLRVRSEGFIQEMLIQGLRDTLRPYGRINPWSSLSSEPSSSLALTAELDAAVQQLNEYLSFLSKVLAHAPLRRIVRQLALAMQTFLWDHVLMRYTFSSSGIAQFRRDVETIWDTMDRWLGEGQGEVGMRKLKEGLTLLSLPVKDRDVDKAGEEAIDLDLWEVEKRVFRSNESGREVLDELGLEVLSESEARNVLERRIELGH